MPGTPGSSGYGSKYGAGMKPKKKAMAPKAKKRPVPRKKGTKGGGGYSAISRDSSGY